ncbi:MAG: RodZ domain-containing protein [Patescibacteria group bacterium]|jgi:cytoskeletal protein RodZ
MKLGEGFTTHRLKSAETLGERLQNAREEANLTLKEISQSIRVRETYIRYLEEGRYSELPADVYVRGFLRSYCNYVGIDFQAALNIYKNERGIQENIKKSKEPAPLSSYKSNSFVITPRLIKICLVCLAVFVMFLYIWFQLSGLSKPPVLTILDPSEDKTVNDDVIVLVGETDLEAEVKINDQPIQVDGSGKFKETVALQDGLNILKIVANNKFGKSTEVKRNIMVELTGDLERQKENEKLALRGEYKKEEPVKDPNSKDKNKTPTTPVKQESELVITVVDKAAWIQIKADDRLIYSGMMLPDASQTFKAKEKFFVSSGKADKTKAVLNGKDLGFLGKEGEVVRDKEIK